MGMANPQGLWVWVWVEVWDTHAHTQTHQCGCGYEVLNIHHAMVGMSVGMHVGTGLGHRNCSI